MSTFSYLEPSVCGTVEREPESMHTYQQYYFGEKDQKKRRRGEGENHWTGPESIEWYNGHFVRDTMNGYGDYRWRYRGAEGAFVTYEGYLLANALHGYGVMSYPDGRTFRGLYYKNIRWGPGVESHANLRQNVGFWRGTQLIRLSWKPMGPSVALDLISGTGGKEAVAPFRVLLAASSKRIGETNSALELLKQLGAEPLVAAEKWPMLYSKHCTDLDSLACHADVFLKDFYDGSIKTLEETHKKNNFAENDSQDSTDYQQVFYAWNNNHTMLHMMKHCYKHDHQRDQCDVKLPRILNGPRRRFRPAGKHESDCRKLLMACYTGLIENVARLINEQEVCPDLSDIQGNTAIMYATCGDQPAIVHFLVEAGANVNSFNDVCVTPLGVALTRLACMEKNIPPKGMVQAVLPKDSSTASQDQNVEEWLITRELPTVEAPTTNKNASKKSISTLKQASSKRMSVLPKSDKGLPTLGEQEFGSENSLTEDEDEKKAFTSINDAYNIKVGATFSGPSSVPAYLFAVTNMMDETLANLEPPAPPPQSKAAKAKEPSKNLKVKSVTQKVKSEIMSRDKMMDSAYNLKMSRCKGLMLTIETLLDNGANPRLVRCPVPALYMAVISGHADLVPQLVQHGVDVNERYPEAHNYSPLAIALTGPLTTDTVDMVRSLLENGADPNIRLDFPDGPGPTLMHVMLAKNGETSYEEDVKKQIMEMLLSHRCDAYAFFEGRSSIDVAMSKNIELLDIFMKTPCVDLNKVINIGNQNILVKLFSLDYFRHTADTERFPILTNLLLYGADPLLECHEGDKTYENVFVYAQEVLEQISPIKRHPSAFSAVMSKENHIKEDAKSHTKTKDDPKSKAKDDKKVDTKSLTKGKPVKAVDESPEYLSLLSLMTECVSMLHVRWLQAKLMKELVATIYKYQHRPWNMIIKEHKNQKAVGFWLTPQRCLEIWDILKSTKKKMYTSDKILKFLLFIVQFYNKRAKMFPAFSPMKAPEKNMIEVDMGHLVNEHKAAAKLSAEAEPWKRPYVKPELEVKADHKYNVCFDCALPLGKIKMVCDRCELVSFCNLDCIRRNLESNSHHPCNDYLHEKYFPASPESTSETVNEIEKAPPPLPKPSKKKQVTGKSEADLDLVKSHQDIGTT